MKSPLEEGSQKRVSSWWGWEDLGIAMIESMICGGKVMDRESRFQLPLASHTSRILRESSFR